MAASQKLDIMNAIVNIKIAGADTPYLFFFLGQKEAYTDLGLSLAECGIEDASADEIDADVPLTTVGQLLGKGKCTRIVAKNSTTGKTHKILVVTAKLQTALDAINSVAGWSANVPVRRRLG